MVDEMVEAIKKAMKDATDREEINMRMSKLEFQFCCSAIIGMMRRSADFEQDNISEKYLAVFQDLQKSVKKHFPKEAEQSAKRMEELTLKVTSGSSHFTGPVPAEMIETITEVSGALSFIYDWYTAIADKKPMIDMMASFTGSLLKMEGELNEDKFKEDNA